MFITEKVNIKPSELRNYLVNAFSERHALFLLRWNSVRLGGVTKAAPFFWIVVCRNILQNLSEWIHLENGTAARIAEMSQVAAEKLFLVPGKQQKNQVKNNESVQTTMRLKWTFWYIFRHWTIWKTLLIWPFSPIIGSLKKTRYARTDEQTLFGWLFGWLVFDGGLDLVSWLTFVNWLELSISLALTSHSASLVSCCVVTDHSPLSSESVSEIEWAWSIIQAKSCKPNICRLTHFNNQQLIDSHRDLGGFWIQASKSLIIDGSRAQDDVIIPK